MTKGIRTEYRDTKLDLNGDGRITEEELVLAERILIIENLDKKDDAQRSMAWFTLIGMILYPVAVVLASFLGLPDTAIILGDMAPTYFASTAALVAAFFGAQAYAARSIRQDDSKNKYFSRTKIDE